MESLYLCDNRGATINEVSQPLQPFWKSRSTSLEPQEEVHLFCVPLLSGALMQRKTAPNLGTRPRWMDSAPCPDWPRSAPWGVDRQALKMCSRPFGEHPLHWVLVLFHFWSRSQRTPQRSMLGFSLLSNPPYSVAIIPPPFFLPLFSFLFFHNHIIYTQYIKTPRGLSAQCLAW